MTCNAADRDVLKDGIIGLLKPVIDEIDARVTDVRYYLLYNCIIA